MITTGVPVDSTGVVEEKAPKEKPKCNCGSHVLHYGKLDMIGGRLHTVMGCERIGPLDIGPLALEIESARQILRGMAPTDATQEAIDHLDAAFAVFRWNREEAK
jgi:hypothetical protein